MNILEFTALVLLGSIIAGLLGALTGLGGGVVIVPMLTLFFDVDIRYAIGASLVSVIATSSGAAAAYVKEGFSNIRIGMFLEIATTLGALLRGVPRAWSRQRGRHRLRRRPAGLSASLSEARPRPSGTQPRIRWPRDCASNGTIPDRRECERITSSACLRASASCSWPAFCPDCSASAPGR